MASVKYERVYLKAYDGVSTARADITDYLGWYNTHRPHSSLYPHFLEDEIAGEAQTIDIGY